MDIVDICSHHHILGQIDDAGALALVYSSMRAAGLMPALSSQLHLVIGFMDATISIMM